jgi:hypothetical protein
LKQMTCVNSRIPIVPVRQFYLQLEVSRAMLASKKATAADARMLRRGARRPIVNLAVSRDPNRPCSPGKRQS